MRANHYPLRHTLQFCRSVYQHPKPRCYAAYLRYGRHLDANAEGGSVVVFHGLGVDPDDSRRPAERTRLAPSGDAPAFFRAVNAHIGYVLHSGGFLPIGRFSRREYISPNTHVFPLATQGIAPILPTVSVGAHLRWTWDTEHHSGRTWLVPLPGRCFLTSQPPAHGPLHRWLVERIRRGNQVKGVDLISGRHSPLSFEDGHWMYCSQKEWRPFEAPEHWRITLDMEALLELGYSEGRSTPRSSPSRRCRKRSVAVARSVNSWTASTRTTFPVAASVRSKGSACASGVVAVANSSRS